jgi:hypothetical protein
MRSGVVLRASGTRGWIRSAGRMPFPVVLIHHILDERSLYLRVNAPLFSFGFSPSLRMTLSKSRVRTFFGCRKCVYTVVDTVIEMLYPAYWR